jgi:hypothetical protein
MRTPPLAVHAPTEAFAPPPTGASLILLLPVHAPLFIRSRLFFICVRPYLIRARPIPRPYPPLWQLFTPFIELCALQFVQYNGSLHPATQRGSHHGQSNSNFILSEVNMVLTLTSRTRALSDVTDERVCPSVAVTTLPDGSFLSLGRVGCEFYTSPKIWWLCLKLGHG